jgi:hypothetical protein
MKRLRALAKAASTTIGSALYPTSTVDANDARVTLLKKTLRPLADAHDGDVDCTFLHSCVRQVNAFAAHTAQRRDASPQRSR